MVLLVFLLADHGVDNSLQDVLFGEDTVHVFDQVVSFIHFVIFEVVDDQVETGFRHHIDQWWENLESILSTSEDN